VATKKKSAAKKSVAKKPAAKKSVAKKPAAKKSSAKKPATKKSVAKKPAAKKLAPKKAISSNNSRNVGVETKKVITTSPTSSGVNEASASESLGNTISQKNRSSRILFMVIAGVVLLAIFALSNSSDDDGAAPKPTPMESVSEEPSNEATEDTEESDEESAAALTYEAPSSFVAINNGSGVTLRWKAPAATEGLTGYLVSISYNAVDFKEVATVPAGTLTLDIARVGDEGGTQFFIQSVYSDGTKADGAKFALKGKYE
jgi:hypothetical protein